MTSILLLPVYFLLVLSLFYFLTKNKIIDLSFKHAAAIFTIKLILGCIYGYLFLKFYNGDDTWLYHRQSLQEYQTLSHHPWQFIKALFSHSYDKSQAITFFDTTNNYWKDLQYNILIKLLAVFNILSSGNYYINVLFFNLLTFWGHYFFYKLFINYFPQKRATAFVIIFLFLPFIFWESGIRKDGLAFIGLSGCLFYFVEYSEHKRIDHLVKAALYFALLVLVRNFVALSLIPVLLAFWSCKYFKAQALYIFSIYTLSFAALFFLSSLGPNAFNLPQKMAERQEAFQHLEGGSYMFVPQLVGTFSSYTNVLPYAINHTFFRPYITEGKSPLLLFAAVETAFILIVIIAALVQIKKLKTITKHPLLMLLLFLALINYLMIGYTVPFAGAIVRYRIFFEVMLLLPMFIICDSHNTLENWLNKRLHLYSY
ncbi:hypothetical protein ACFOW1_14570 [Parasediminibacterium paludis]|uniref:Dolichyl-phosphate-mannose-protein mannosyltransferase n=1 Tax=Parasediminibacterium paludis TaxID=908966 RepID=A0ABV8Q114_9BACT